MTETQETINAEVQETIAKMRAWSNDVREWQQGMGEILNRIVTGLMPSTDEADALVLEILELEKQQKAFSVATQGAEVAVLNWGPQITSIRDDMDIIEAQATLDCTETNAGKRKAEMTLALAKDEDYQELKKKYRDVEYDRLVATAHLEEVKRDRGRISTQVWSRRARLEHLTARVNLFVKGETK